MRIHFSSMNSLSRHDWAILMIQAAQSMQLDPRGSSTITVDSKGEQNITSRQVTLILQAVVGTNIKTYAKGFS